jgi:hypothetical protein
MVLPLGMRRSDVVHLGLMLAAFGLTYVMPFELLVLAYVVLGPAHYTTEISWLHDRNYFLAHRGHVIALVAIALGAALIDNASWFGVVMWAALVVCAVLTATRSPAQGIVLLIVATGLTAIMYRRWPALAVIGVLLPTLIHVSAFTLIFMGLGAWRARSAAQGWLIAIYLTGIAAIVAVPPSAATVIPQFAQIAHAYFGNVPLALGALFGVGDIRLDGRLTGLLAFVYTYHYLNWFIKAEVIRWADIPPTRWLLVGGVSAASTGLYFYDYALGFSVLLALSLVHVVLEFPLNALAARQLADAIGIGVMHRFAPARGARRTAASGRARLPPRRTVRR